MTELKSQEKPRKMKVWIALVVLTAAMLGLSIWLMGPAPPRRIVFATGQAGGGYDAFGKQYQARLRRMGLEVELVNTNGSVDNLQRLVGGQVDVAFVQAGTYPLVDDPQQRLRGLVSVYLEPLWVFYRSSGPVSTLSDLKGRPMAPPVTATTAVGLLGSPWGSGPLLTYSTLVTGRIPTISIGPERSGTEAVGKLLLKAHGITAQNARIVNLDTAEARQGLKDGSIDVALIISSARDPAIPDLLAQKELQLMNFQRQDVAHFRQFPYLNPVKLTEGLLNLRDNIPREERTLLAPAALLVCREDLHPQVIELILKAARRIHAPGSLIDPPNRFPTLEGVDVAIHETAETYMTSGESFLTRVLPYWGVRLMLLLRILILPMVAVWLPILKILPMVYNFRVNRLLKRHYAALRALESAIGQTTRPEELRDRLRELEQLRSDMETLTRKVPAHLQRDVYHWRLHVAVVRTEALERLTRLETPRDSADPKPSLVSALAPASALCG
jgi:TRAP-type uncharacterized transport system substrate-binding protein